MKTKTDKEMEQFPIEKEFDEVFRIFALNFRILRAKHNIDDAELSQKLDIPKYRVANLACGSHRPNINEIIKIVDYFPITYDTLLEKEIELAI